MGVKVREKPKASGAWWVFISHNGKRKSKYVGSEKLALEVADKIKAKISLGEFEITERKQRAPTFKTYADDWLNLYVKALRSFGTYDRYRIILNSYIYPAIGNVRIDELKRGDLRNLLLKFLNSGLSAGTVSLIRNVISGPLSYAVDEELLPSNPSIGLTKKLRLREQKTVEIEPLNFQEVDLFLETCRNHFLQHYPLFLCAFRSGMRIGEILALKWGDVDWNGQFIRVSKSYRNGRTTKTKTGKPRRVDASDQLLATLKELHTAAKKNALKEGAPVPELIFCKKGGKSLEQGDVRFFKMKSARD